MPTQAAVGARHVCAILQHLDSNGRQLERFEVACWGSNDFGALGLFNTTKKVGISQHDMGDALQAVNLEGGKPLESETK